MTAATASARARPDLAVTGVKVSSPHVQRLVGETDTWLTIRVRVANRGSARAGRSWIAYYLSRDRSRSRHDVVVDAWQVPSLHAHRWWSSQASSFVSGTRTGRWNLLACADATHRVRERSERNNCRASAAFRVRPADGGSPGEGRRGTPACGERGWRTRLCGLLREAIAKNFFYDMADALTFSLLYQHLSTGRYVPASLAARAIAVVRHTPDPVRARWDPSGAARGVWNYRVAGFLDFWKDRYGRVDWRRYPGSLDTVQEFDSWWQTYLLSEQTARQNAINNVIGAMVSSEQAYQQAVQSWTAYDRSLVTAQQYSDAVVDAQRTLDDAKAAVAAAGG